MKLACGNIKGGVGKTTMAVNIAIARTLAGCDVLLIDADPQQTASIFADVRAARMGRADYMCISLSKDALRTQVPKMAAKYDDVILDVGGHDDAALRSAMITADVLLIPVQPRTFDVWVLRQMAELVHAARTLNDGLRALVLLNAADAQGRDNEDAVRIIEGIEGLEMLPAWIGRRKAFSNAAAEGRSVLEYLPRDHKACSELEAVLDMLYAR